MNYVTTSIKAIIAAMACLFVWANAEACSVDSSGPMPICETPYFSADERIVVLKLQSGERYSDIDVWVEPYGGEQNVPTEPITYRGHWDLGARSAFRQHSYVSDINIGALKEPVTLVLSSYNAVIVRISGNTKNVNRVVVLGSRRYGPGAIGVVGIEPEKVEHLPVIGRDEGRKTVCASPGLSCMPEQFFKLRQSEYKDYAFQDMEPYANLRPVSAFSAGYTDTNGEFKTTYAIMDIDGVNIIEGAEGPEIELDRTQANLIYKDYSLEEWRALRAKYGAYGEFVNTKIAVVSDIDPETIVSPFNFTKSEQLPGWHGMEELRSDGMLLLRPDAEFKTRYDAYVEKSDKWRGDKKLKMDIILLKDIKVLPRELRDVMQQLVIFVPNGVNPPKIPNQSSACFLYEISPVKIPGVYDHACRSLVNKY